MQEVWELFSKAITPWIHPHVGTVAEKMAALEGNQGKIDAWVVKRTALGYTELSYYYHWFVEHSDEARKFFLKELPGIAIQDVVCQAKEHANKLTKQEFAPLASMLRNGKLKNAFYHVMRNWNARILHFIDTIPVKRIIQCHVCKRFGHQQN